MSVGDIIWLGDGTIYKKCQVRGTDYTCSRSCQAEGAGRDGRQVRLPEEMVLGRIGTVDWRKDVYGKFPAEGLLLAHLGNTLVFREKR